MSDKQAVSRRNVLKSIGAGSVGVTASSQGLSAMGAIGAVDARNEPADRTIRFEAAARGTYDVTVTGLLSPNGDTAGDVTRNRARGTLEHATDEYSFSGEIESLSVADSVTVYVDGTRVDESDVFDSTIQLKAAGADGDFDLSVSGGLRHVRGPDPDGHRATGALDHGSVEYRYSGELTYLDVPDDAKIRVDGEKRTQYNALGIDVPDEVRIRGATNGVTHYRIEFLDVSQVRAGPAMADRPAQKPITDQTVTGKVADTADATHPNGPDSLLYGGRVSKIATENGPTVEVNPRKSTLTVGVDGTTGDYKLAASGSLVRADGDARQASVSGTITDGPVTYSYRGRLEHVKLGDELLLEFNPGKYEETAVASKKLQLHARMERWDHYEDFERKASARGGYLRRDPNGLIASHTTGELFDQPVPNQLVVTSDLVGDIDADDASATLARDTEADALRRAIVRYRTDHADDRRTVTVIEAKGDGDLLRTPLAWERQTTTLDPHALDGNGSHAQSGFSLQDGIDYIVDSTVNTILSLQEQATRYIDSNAVSKMWSLKIGGIESLYALAESGLLTEMTDGDGDLINCAGCVGTTKAFIQSGVCGFAADYACAVLSVSGPGAIGCVLFVELLCSAIDTYGGGSEYLARQVCNYDQLNAC